MIIRYPEGMRSTVDADLTLRGPYTGPTLGGTVTVRDAVWSKRFLTGADLTALRSAAAPAAATVESTLPILYDVHVIVPGTFRIRNNAADIVANADLTLQGTYDRPALAGRMDLRGTMIFESNRYRLIRGTVDFFNPTRIEPWLDLEAETRVRVPGQTYRVSFTAAGTPDHLNLQFSSDPPLPSIDVIGLMFGQLVDPQTAEIRALRAPQRTEEELIRSVGERLLLSPLSAPVSRAVETALGIDTVSFTPLLSQSLESLSPTARLTIGKRISSRAYLTFSRGLGSSSQRDQIILVEYDASDRVAWILTQNENGTYSLDFRVRHVF
jgi:hypothetical protein